MREPEDAGPSAWSPVQAACGFALLVLLTVLLALWGAFLVPFRVGATLVPVSWAVAGIGNVAVSRVGARLGGTLGGLVPGAVWLVVVVLLSSQRSEGDLVVPGTVVGVGFLLTGALASAGACATSVLRRRPQGEPAGASTARR